MVNDLETEVSDESLRTSHKKGCKVLVVNILVYNNNIVAGKLMHDRSTLTSFLMEVSIASYNKWIEWIISILIEPWIRSVSSVREQWGRRGFIERHLRIEASNEGSYRTSFAKRRMQCACLSRSADQRSRLCFQSRQIFRLAKASRLCSIHSRFRSIHSSVAHATGDQGEKERERKGGHKVVGWGNCRRETA